MNRTVLSAFLFLTSLFTHAQDNNISTPLQQTHNLDEVVVKGKYARIEGSKFIFFPRKSEKNLSRNMEDLIRRMHTGILIVEDGKIITQSGQSVNIFINGEPVDDIDKSTFWAKNALRVEFMEFSDNPQFHGATNIVNFIMREYVVGGLTKIDGNQQLPNDGSYSAASKLVRGKMTYNAILNGAYSRDHQSGSNLSESYDNIFYRGDFYDRVLRHEAADEIKRSDNLYGGFNARYRTDKTIVMHSIALQWNENPGSVTHGAVAYSPEIISSERMTSKTKSHSISPMIEGYYSYMSLSKWSFAAKWGLSHSHNNNYDSYTDIGLEPIATLSEENIYNLNANLKATWNFRNNLVFQFNIDESRVISKAVYFGDINSNQWQNNGINMLQILAWWKISNKIVMQVTPQISLNDWNVNHSVKKTEWLSGINATVLWSINDKNRINFDSWFYQKSPSSSQKNDLTLRSTELKWIEGNPTINSSSNYWLTLSYNMHPNSWFNNTMSLDFISNMDEPYLSYRPGGKTHEGVVGQYQNSPSRQQYRGIWSFGIDLLGGNLRFGNQLEYSYQKINKFELSWVRTRPYISWDFGNCSLSANYGTPEKFFRQGGTMTVTTPSYYNLDFTYGNGNLIFDIELSTPFHKHLNTKTLFNNGPYHYNSKAWNNGCNISISYTYTFDYGKKVDPGIEIYQQNLKSTSLLYSEK